MSEQNKTDKSAIDLPQNSEVSELQEQELNNISTIIRALKYTPRQPNNNKPKPKKRR